jgi:EAL domain-containing protein (putative c-di-GMP-specific phosphodiesterase class I)
VIVKAILALGRGLGLSIIAEGVENERQVALLTALGFETVQGFYFSRPLGGDHLLKLLQTGSDRLEPLSSEGS